MIFAKIRRHRKSHPGLRQLANARNQLTAVGGCSNSLGAERLAGSGWGTLGDRSTTTASGIGVGVGVGVGADGVLVESRTPQGANSSWSVPAFRSVKPSAFFFRRGHLRGYRQTMRQTKQRQRSSLRPAGLVSHRLLGGLVKLTK